MRVPDLLTPHRRTVFADGCLRLDRERGVKDLPLEYRHFSVSERCAWSYGFPAADSDRRARSSMPWSKPVQRFPGAKRIRLFCRADRAAATACIIDVRIDVAPELAHALGTMPFGNTVVPEIGLAAEFSCPGRIAGEMIAEARDDCVRVLPPPVASTG